jgi:hypothetical protein
VAVEPLAVAVKTVMIVNMILPHMDLSVVIQHGMSMVLIVPRWKAAITGIVLDVIAQVIRPVNVVTALVTVMKTVKAVLQTVVNVVIVRMDI